MVLLLKTLRDLQVLDTQSQSSQAAGPRIVETNNDLQDLPEIIVDFVQETVASTEDACVAKDQKHEDDKPLAGLQILLPEYTFVLQTIQRKMLNQFGGNAQDGVVVASASRDGTIVPLLYDVIFMDCHMPKMDGYEATKIIREEERHHGIHTPIIAQTAHEMQEDLEKAILIGKDLHITKPIEMKRIVEVVRSVYNTRIRRNKIVLKTTL
ncbi:hypothetical protein U9M48_035386 [Paspalum notatum var. saurae]|uniref:Response regulatory domain-containing protein n=1 Tax=Paspalum notatum var. saurae TaxID=547442 RepID=A0AAQ3UB04_PASNO